MTQRFVTIKSEEDIPEKLKDLVSLQITDNAVEAVIVKVDDQFIRIVKKEAYSANISVLTEAPKVRKVKYVVSGDISGVEIAPKEFDTEYEAQEFKSLHWQADLKIEEKEYFVDETKI